MFSIILLSLVGSYLLLALFALFFADRMIFPAPPATYTAESLPVKTIPLAGGSEVYTYARWQTDTARPTLLYFHGNAEDLGQVRFVVDQLHELGFSVLAVDYPGYGLSPGLPSEQGTFAAADAAFRYLTAERGMEAEQIFLFGRSLGSGPAVWLASQHTVGGIVLDSPFTSTFRVLTKRRLLPWDRFDNLGRIDRITSPLLIFHGTRDQVVPFSHGQQLFAAAPEPKRHVWIEGAQHNTVISTAGNEYWRQITDFVNEYSAAKAD